MAEKWREEGSEKKWGEEVHYFPNKIKKLIIKNKMNLPHYCEEVSSYLFTVYVKTLTAIQKSG